MKGFSATDVSRVVAELNRDGFQSDHRFADSFIYNRIQRGYGPVRISRELVERGVDEQIIDTALAAIDEDWNSRLREVHAKKFGSVIPRDYREQARQTRFLLYRGFTHEQIRCLFNRD